MTGDGDKLVNDEGRCEVAIGFGDRRRSFYEPPPRAIPRSIETLTLDDIHTDPYQLDALNSTVLGTDCSTSSARSADFERICRH